MLRGGERSHFLSYLKLLDSQQNAKPDLEQLKLFLLLLKAAINLEVLEIEILLFSLQKISCHTQDVIYSRRTSLLLTGKCWDEVSDSSWLSELDTTAVIDHKGQTNKDILLRWKTRKESIDSLSVKYLQFPTPWWWWCHLRPCRTGRMPPWIQRSAPR